MSSWQQSLLALLALQAADTEIESCRRRIRALQAELAIERLNRSIAALDKRLYDASLHTVREAESVQKAMAHRRAGLSTTEGAVPAAMERTEKASLI